MFYATPQTLLNDLVGGYVDALDIILLVIGMRGCSCIYLFLTDTICQTKPIEGPAIMHTHRLCAT